MLLWSEKIRHIAEREFVVPARGGSHVKIRLGDLKQAVMKQEREFPPQHANQIASSIESQKFWGPLGLTMCSPRGQSRKVDTVIEFKFLDQSKPAVLLEDDPLLKLVGLLRGAIREGADAFIKELRRDKETEQ